MFQNTLHTEQFTIRANEVDTSGKLTLPAICTFFQEVAGNNAKDLKFDITDMQQQNLTWVLHRMDININRKVQWRDTIHIETWPAASDSLRAYRNYRIIDSKHQEIGNCLSYWIVMNLATRRPSRIPQEVLDMRLLDKAHVTQIKNNRMKPFTIQGTEKEIIVRRADVDMNNHVNNVRYIEWMLETLDLEIVHKIQNFDVMFTKEAFVDDRLISSSYRDKHHIFFKITDSQSHIISVAEATI